MVVVKYLLILLFTICGLGLTQECDENLVYMQILVTTEPDYPLGDLGLWFYYKSEFIYQFLYFTPGESIVYHICLSSTPNQVYTIIPYSMSGTPWIGETSVIFINAYGDHLLTAKFYGSYVEVDLTIQQQIPKNGMWKYTSGALPPNWFTNSFDDSLWPLNTLPRSAMTVNGVQYYRRSFESINNMVIPAYLVKLNYRYGVAVYIDGVEIIRDNLPEGPITNTTASIATYEDYDYRGYIRQGNEVQGATKRIAVELHFPANQVSNSMLFDAYIQFLGSSCESACYSCNYFNSIGSSYTATRTVLPLFDGNIYSEADIYTNFYYDLTYTDPVISPSGLLLHASMISSTGAPSITLSGYRQPTSENSTTFFSSIHPDYNLGKWTLHAAWNTNSNYRKIRIGFPSLNGNYNGKFRAQEMKLVVCPRISKTQIAYEANEVTVISNTFLSLYTVMGDYQDCTSDPPLPLGLTMDATCTIQGMVTAEPGDYSVIIFSSLPVAQTLLTFHVVACDQITVEVEYSYPELPYTRPSASIMSVDTNETIWVIPVPTKARLHTTTALCLEPKAYQLVMDIQMIPCWEPEGKVDIYQVSGDYKHHLIHTVYNMMWLTQNTLVFEVGVEVAIRSMWRYHFDSIPQNWTDSLQPSWEEGNRDSFPSSNSTHRLFQRTFSLSSVNSITSIHVSVLYQFGIILYLNGLEAFRSRVSSGPLSSSTVYNGEEVYSEAFHSITIPYRRITALTDPKEAYVHSGSNLVSIAIITPFNVSTAFDAYIACERVSELNRNFDSRIESSSQAAEVDVGIIFDLSADYFWIYNSGAESEFLQIEFANQRHEWINQIILGGYYFIDEVDSIYQFKFYGITDEGAEELLESRESIGYWGGEKMKMIDVLNDKAYNKYIFRHFYKNGDGLVILYKVILRSVRQEISYRLEMHDIYLYNGIPTTETPVINTGFDHFTITPSLPLGIKMDSITGVIYGTPISSLSPSTIQHTVSARYRGYMEETNRTIVVRVMHCEASKHHHVQLEMSKSDDLGATTQSWILEKEEEGKRFGVMKRAYLPYSEATSIEYEMCLRPGQYHITVYSHKREWEEQNGFRITEYDKQLVVVKGVSKYNAKQDYPFPTTKSFILHDALIMGQSSWKYLNSQCAPSEWTSSTFDDTDWESGKGLNFGYTMTKTVYFRQVLLPADREKDTVISLYTKYNGGFIAYFNGERIARFRLKEDANCFEESLLVDRAIHTSFFHVVLDHHPYQTLNILAVELHLPKQCDEYCTAQFGMSALFSQNGLTSLQISTSSLSGDVLEGEEIEKTIDEDYLTAATIQFVRNSFIEWSFDNQEGVLFNAFTLRNKEEVSFDWKILGGPFDSSLLYDLTEGGDKEHTRYSEVIKLPSPMQEYGHYRFEVERQYLLGSITLFEFELYYLSIGSEFCERDGAYPRTRNGEMAWIPCGDLYEGVIYRSCESGAFGPARATHCVLKEITSIRYANLTLAVGITMRSVAPEYSSLAFYFSVSPSLPKGLRLDFKTGEISGTPERAMALSAFTIRGWNERSEASTSLFIEVKSTSCETEAGDWIVLGGSSRMSCSKKGAYVGSYEVVCVVENNEAIWSGSDADCMTVAGFLVIVTVIILLIILLIVFVERIIQSNEGELDYAFESDVIALKKSPIPLSSSPSQTETASSESPSRLSLSEKRSKKRSSV